MPRGKKLAVGLSVLVAGTAPHFFRKDASPLWSWHDARTVNPFFDRIERRATKDVSWSTPGVDGPAATPPRSATRVLPATAAIVQPGGAPSGQPTFHRSLSPVAALLEPIEAVGPDAEEGDEPGGLSRSAASPDGYVTHTITDGDTLSRLAGQYLGSSERYLEIYEANRELLASPDLLPIGKVLKIPLGQSGAALPGTRGPPTADDDPSLRLVPLSQGPMSR